MDFTNKAVLVTGAGSGIGEATAAVLKERGAHLVLLGIEDAPLRLVADRLGAIPIVGDAADAPTVRRAVAAAQERWGGLDGLAACAGGGGMGKLGEIGDEAWARALRITLTTASVSARECLPALIARKGAIVLVSSIGGVHAPPMAAGYATAKAALIGLTRSLAADYGPDIRVNAICPGLTRTAVGDMVMGELAKAAGVDRDQAYAIATRWFPLKRAAEPVEIARAITFLLSDWSSYMTGAVVIADGGSSAVSPAV